MRRERRASRIPECLGNECEPAPALLHRYAGWDDKDPATYRVAGHGNAWRLYLEGGKALSGADVAELIRKDQDFGERTKQVKLLISWSGQQTGSSERLADQLANALGVPVVGPDGFLWFGPDGQTKITSQSFTAYKFPYEAKEGDFVMASVVVAVPDEMIEEARKSRDVAFIRGAAMSEDVFGLRPEKALELYDRASELGDEVSRQNAALIRKQQPELGR